MSAASFDQTILNRNNFSVTFGNISREKDEWIKTKKYSVGDCNYYKGEQNNAGQYHGEGHFIYKDAAEYIGQYRRGLRHGFGKFFYPNCSAYEGEWRSNMRHGYGRYCYSNGDYYEGYWSIDRKHGIGTYYSKEFGILFRGIWQKGTRSGPAVIIFERNKLSLHVDWNEKSQQVRGSFVLNSSMQIDGVFRKSRCKNVAFGQTGPYWLLVNSAKTAL